METQPRTKLKPEKVGGKPVLGSCRIDTVGCVFVQ